MNFSEETLNNDIWRMLGKAVVNSSPWSDLSEVLPDAIEVLICKAKEPSTFIPAIVEKLADIKPSAIKKENFAGLFVSISQSILTHSEQIGIKPPLIPVPGGASAYLAVIADKNSNDTIVHRLSTDETDANLIGALVANLQKEAKACDTEPKIKALLRTDKKPDWSPLINAATQIIQGTNANATNMASALSCLGLLRVSQDLAKKQIAQLISTNHLTPRLNEADSKKNVAVEARLLALFILINPNAALNSNINWDKLPSSNSKLPEELDKLITTFDGDITTDKIVSAASNSEKLLPIIKSVVTLRVINNHLGRLHINDIINNIDKYLSCVDDEYHESFIEKISYYDTFWDELEKACFSTSAIKILRTLLKNEEIRNHACDLIQKAFESVTEEEWGNAVKNNAEPLLLAFNAKQVGPIKIGNNLYNALRDMRPKILEGADENLRDRWFKAAQFIPDSHRKILFRDIRDSIHGGSSPAALVNLLRTGGKQLLNDGKFSSEPDKAVRQIVLPLCSSADGIEWLHDESKNIAIWIKGAMDETKQVVADTLCSQKQKPEVSYGDIIDKLLTSWNLPDPSTEPSPDDESNEES